MSAADFGRLVLLAAVWGLAFVFIRVAVMPLGPVALVAQAPGEIVWTFDRLDNIGGIKTTVEGSPRIVDTPLGKAIEFDGVDDAVWI